MSLHTKHAFVYATASLSISISGIIKLVFIGKDLEKDQIKKELDEILD